MSSIPLHLSEMINRLPACEKRIAVYIIDNSSKIVGMPLTQLAEECQTSPGSISRLCKRLGISGYRELVHSIASELIPSVSNTFENNDIVPGDTLEEITRKVCTNNIHAIENTLDIVDMNEFARAVDAINRAGRIDFYGTGTSGLVALDAHNKFLRICKTSYGSNDPHQQILCAYSLRPGDTAVLISYSGETKDILECAEIAKQRGATLISLTRYCNNSLKDMVDIRLYSCNIESLIRSGPMSSRISQLTVIDMLYTSVASSMYDQVKMHLEATQKLARRKARVSID